MGQIIINISNWLWGAPLMLILGGGGLFLTFRLGFVQFRHFGYICSQTFGKVFEKKEEGKISSFQASSASLAACVGASNIVGVPVAIAFGGPGALFWMWVLALLGAATKFTEITLGVKYREKNKVGEYAGGPEYYLEKGIKNKKIGKALALTYAFIMMVENVPSAATQVVSAIQSAETIGLQPIITGLIIIGVVALVALGGFKRITKVTDKLVPFMVIAYLLGAVVIFIQHIEAVPEAFILVFKSAFTPAAAVGGFAGASVAAAIRWGAARGAYSNEAGMGSAAISHSQADVDHPVRQGLWGVFECVIDTIIICSLSGFVCLVSGVWKTVPSADAASMPSIAFSQTYGIAGSWLVSILLMLFVISTLIVLVYVGEKCAEYLLGIKFAKIWRYMYFVGMLFGVFGGLEFIYQFLDFFVALLLISNLIGVFALNGEVVKLTKEYFHTEGKYYLKDMADKKAKKEAKRKRKGASTK